MLTDIVTAWWTCPGCGEDAELAGPAPAGCGEPCPDCSADMVLCWEVQQPLRARGLSAA